MIDVLDITAEAAMRRKRWVWADTETTGLDDKDLLLEISVVVTEPDLTVVGDPVSIVIRADLDTAHALMIPYVRDMHTASGLLDDCAKAHHTLPDAEEEIMKYVCAWVDAGVSPLCGSTIPFDRKIIARDLPVFNNYLHYRHIDVSGFKEVTRRWFPDVYDRLPPRVGTHRALPDIFDSLREMAFYRDNVLGPRPAAEVG